MKLIILDAKWKAHRCGGCAMCVESQIQMLVLQLIILNHYL